MWDFTRRHGPWLAGDPTLFSPFGREETFTPLFGAAFFFKIGFLIKPNSPRFSHLA